MKLRAGSLYKNYLVLYGENVTPRAIVVDNEILQWDIYCNPVEFTAIDSETAEVIFEGTSYNFKYLVTENPTKDLGFGA